MFSGTLEQHIWNGPVPPVRKKHLKKLSSHGTAEHHNVCYISTDTKPREAVHYPVELNPFPENSIEDTATSSEYDDSLNPFRDDLGSDGESLGSQTTATDDSHLADGVSSGHHEPCRNSSAPSTLHSKTTSPGDRLFSPQSSSPAEVHKSKTAPPFPPPVLPKPSSLGSEIKCNPDMAKRKKRRAPPPPVPLRREIPCTFSMNEDEIISALKSVDEDYAEIERYGRLIEQRARCDMNKGDTWLDEGIVETLYKLICKRVFLFSKEMELASCYRERQLNAVHSEVEFRLRCIVEKPDEIKTDEDANMEALLLQKLLKVIDEKSYLDETDSPFYSNPARVDHLQSILVKASDRSKENLEERKKRKTQFGRHDKKRLLRRLKKLQIKLGHKSGKKIGRSFFGFG
ncbi:unnamed protein product [Soboliphyme baturini]|uniref:BMERB domain-containing protein n=1 Tax=Soboliphyme baturini TaxID=241478 RepID=A0A183ICS7_9BILA|nr:unnamed protein product [Soboliphyme baturini]